MKKPKHFTCLNPMCGEFTQGYPMVQGNIFVENKECFFNGFYGSREEWQKELDRRCQLCIENKLIREAKA